jgi:hypothetical protein
MAYAVSLTTRAERDFALLFLAIDAENSDFCPGVVHRIAESNSKP